MSVIEEVTVGRVRVELARGLLTVDGRLVDSLFIRLGRQRFFLRDARRQGGARHPSRVTALLALITSTLKAREAHMGDFFLTAPELLEELDDYIAFAGAETSFEECFISRQFEGFYELNIALGLRGMLQAIDVDPRGPLTLGGAAGLLRAALARGSDFDRVTYQGGDLEVAWHPDEHRPTGGSARWLRIRARGQEIYAQARFEADGGLRGRNDEADLAEALGRLVWPNSD